MDQERKNDGDDLINSLPPELTLSVVEYLSPVDIVTGLASTSRHLRETIVGPIGLGMKHSTLLDWTHLCNDLWTDKIYVPVQFRSNPSCHSYFGSIRDAQRSTFVDVEEFCSLHFHFRFRLSAGEYWTSKDPSFGANLDGVGDRIGGSNDELDQSACRCPMYRQFRPDGTIARRPPTADEDDSCSASGSRNETGMARTEWCIGPVPDPLENDEEVQSFVPKIRWRFTKTRDGVKGQYVKLNNWPSYTIERTLDWGWKLRGIWTYYRTCCQATRTMREEWYHDAADDYDEVVLPY